MTAALVALVVAVVVLADQVRRLRAEVRAQGEHKPRPRVPRR